VLGSLVWDEIHGRDPAEPPVEEWGGIAYALAGFDAALGPEWEIVPLIKVGRDLREEATRFLASLTRLAPGTRPVEVDTPNNRVVLRYESRERRCERMSGGVPPWTWSELGPMVLDLDAVYVNFIAGFELGLGTAEALRRAFPGFLYADLHSLFLAMRGDGVRALQPLPDAPSWFRCFDVVQMNEEELSQLGADPLAVATTVVGWGATALVVTLGARGAWYVTVPEGPARLPGHAGGGASPPAPPPGGHRYGAGGVTRSGLVPAPQVEVLDPTGCGDVFGATCCARLLAGDDLETAVAAANQAAARNAMFRGASGLAAHLRGELQRA
jgi:hypothetical protein